MHLKKKVLALLLVVALLATLIPAFAVPNAEAEPITLGNLPINSLNGGVLLETEDGLFVSNPMGIWFEGTLLTADTGRNLNLHDGFLYYSIFEHQSIVRRLCLESGLYEDVFSQSGEITQMLLINGHTLYLLADGTLHHVNLITGARTTSNTHNTVWRFVPTVYGTIYATGSFGSLSLWAEDRLLEETATQFFTEDEHLIIRRGAQDYEISFADAFLAEVITASAYVSRVPDAIETFAHRHIDGGDCPECIQIFEATDPELGVLPLEMIETFTLPLTPSQENVVRRARQQLEIRWTPLENVTGWRGNTTFYAGETYIGIPYGQPIHSGRYIPWAASFEHFASAVQNINSNMYRNFSFIGTHATIAPYYASDCSSFVSWALNHPRRTTTYTFPQYASRITQSLYALQVGDVFNSAPHNILVTAVEFDANGNLVAVETMEQTIPLPRQRRYGVGGTNGGLEQLIQRTFNGGYHLYRSHTIDNVPFTPSPAVNVEDGYRHLVAATASNGGVISPSGMVPVPAGYNQTFVFHARRGYAVSRVLVNGVDIGAPTQFIMQNVQSAASISVEFELTGSPFDDVNPTDWFHDAVFSVFYHGLMQGATEREFHPHQNATRAMFVTILARMAGVNPANYAPRGTVSIAAGTTLNLRSGASTAHAVIGSIPAGANVQIIGRDGNFYRVRHGSQTGFASRDHITSQRGSFTDVLPGAWYAPYVQWAYENDITRGTGNNRFSPALALNRQEMVTLLHNFQRQAGMNLPQQNRPAFTDIDAVADWARDAVVFAQGAGIIQGVGGNSFAPHELANRASLAALIASFHEMIN